MIKTLITEPIRLVRNVNIQEHGIMGDALVLHIGEIDNITAKMIII